MQARHPSMSHPQLRIASRGARGSDLMAVKAPELHVPKARSWVKLSLVEALPPKGFVWAGSSPDVSGLVSAPPQREHTDGHMWDAETCAEAEACSVDGFQDFERECFGDEDGCDYWFYGGPSQFTDDDPTADSEHISRITADGLAVVKARQLRKQQEEQALQRVKGMRSK